MALIHVCPLAHVESTLAASGARHVVSLLSQADRVPDLAGLPPDRHLHLALSDITAPTPSHVLAASTHIEALLRFLRGWDGSAPLLIHCFAGVSRSTAAAFVALCALDPDRSETDHAAALRAASPTATPNPHLIALADAMLGRAGRMSAAAAAIGRGVECFEGNCFAVGIASPAETGARSVAMV